MTAFHSLYQQEQDDTEALRPWPAVFREAVPPFDRRTFALQIRIENQLPKLVSESQLQALPSFTENRRITSRAGWTFYGQFKGTSFHTLLSLFSTPHLYPWARLESMNGQHSVMERKDLLNYRIVTEYNGQPLSTLYGGPLWVISFEEYIEYSIPHLKSIVLMQGEHTPYYPNDALGFKHEDAKLKPGRYYDIHHERMVTV